MEQLLLYVLWGGVSALTVSVAALVFLTL